MREASITKSTEFHSIHNPEDANKHNAKRARQEAIAARMDARLGRINYRLQPVEAAIDGLSRRLSERETNQALVLERLEVLEKGWRQHVPGLLNAVSSIAAFGYELAALQREMKTTAEELREAIA